MLRILIVDDHAIVRQGLKQIVAEEFEPAVLGEAGSAQALVEAVRDQEWDVVVLDINLPDQSGLEVLRQVKELRPTLPVLILSIHPEEQYAVRALKSGASGYLTKESAPEELIAAMRKVMGGGRYVSSSLAEQLAINLSLEHDIPMPRGLSDREHQVIERIAQGKTVTQTAGELSLSIKTISTYRARLLKKLRLKTTAQLIRYALDNQLVQ